MGWIILLPSVAAQIPFYNSSYTTIGIVVAVTAIIQIGALIISIIPTEIALSKNFFDNGNRK